MTPQSTSLKLLFKSIIFCMLFTGCVTTKTYIPDTKKELTTVTFNMVDSTHISGAYKQSVFYDLVIEENNKEIFFELAKIFKANGWAVTHTPKPVRVELPTNEPLTICVSQIEVYDNYAGVADSRYGRFKVSLEKNKNYYVESVLEYSEENKTELISAKIIIYETQSDDAKSLLKEFML